MNTTITFLGHTTVLVQTAGLRFIFDPNFNQKIFFIKRLGPPCINPEELHQVNVILISNAHYHRLDLPSFKYFRQTSQIISPLGLGRIFRHFYSFRISELRAGAETSVGDCQITGLKALHHGFRNHPVRYSRCLNYLIKTPTQNIFYCGDNSYDGSYFYEIGQKDKIDVAVIPVDHVCPDFLAKKRHMTFSQALQAFRDLGARCLIPNNFGAFNFKGRKFEDVTEHLLSEMNRQGLTDEVRILKPGETTTIAKEADRIESLAG